MKKIIGIAAILLLVAAVYVAQKYWSSNTAFEGKKTIYIPTNSTYEQLLQVIKTSNALKDFDGFESMAQQLNLPNKVHPGKYEITEGTSNYKLVKMLRSGDQKPVQLVLKKYRTQADVINKICSQLEADSAELKTLLNNNSYLAPFGLDSVTAIGAFTPNTYEFYWNSNAKKVFEKLVKGYQNIWTHENVSKAKALKLSPNQVMTVASIVDEETNATSEKGNVASVYLNRINNGMKLQADPTVKYAIGDFTIKRVLTKHLSCPSPYNTYYVSGLPPGPICTPLKESITAVLNAPKTSYLYFCASPDKVGYHNFATTGAEHLANAKKFQDWLDKRGIKK
jgi:UPF0755 protein